MRRKHIPINYCHFAEVKKSKINVFFQPGLKQGRGSIRLASENISRSFLYRTIQVYRLLSVQDRHRVGRLVSLCTRKLKECIRSRISINLRRSMRMMVGDSAVNRETYVGILQKQLVLSHKGG